MNIFTRFMKYDGKLKFPVSEGISSTSFLNQVEKLLLFERAKNISRHGDIISFEGSFFRFRWTARFLSIIDKGFIRVVTEDQYLVVIYRLSFLRLFWNTFPISFLIPTFFVLSEGIGYSSAISLFGLIFGITFGINFIVSFISVFLFIKFAHMTIHGTNWVWKILYWFS